MQSSTSSESLNTQTKQWDIELCEFAEKNLYTAVVSDSLDQLGIRHQAMREYLRPVHGKCTFAGWARTIACSDIYHILENPYDTEIAAVDSLLPGEVAVVGTQKSQRNAPWGELLSTAALARRASGCVTDAMVRDVRQVRSMGFPVFHGGIGPLDTKGRGRMVERDVPVECAGVLIAPGDIVFGDIDGVVVIPRSHEGAVLDKALAKVQGENDTRDALRRGEPLAVVFKRFGIL